MTHNHSSMTTEQRIDYYREMVAACQRDGLGVQERQWQRLLDEYVDQLIVDDWRAIWIPQTATPE